MSKKTKNIYQKLDNLDLLQKQIYEISMDQANRDLQNIQFEMQQELKSLRFWIDSLYSYNGKSTSNAKKTSSKENGKKGGRPPKQITLSRKRIIEIEDILIPQINHDIKLTDDDNLEAKLKNDLLQLESELENCRIVVQQWENQKLNK